MVYVGACVYALIAITFLCFAGSRTAKILPRSDTDHDHVWTLHYERRMAVALSFLSLFLIMVAIAILKFISPGTDWMIEHVTSNADKDAVVAASWVLWSIAWITIPLCIIVAIVGIFYLCWEKDKHVRLHDALKHDWEIVRIAYLPKNWGRGAKAFAINKHFVRPDLGITRRFRIFQ